MACFVTTSNEVQLSFKAEVPCQNPFVEDLSATQAINFSSTTGFAPNITFENSPSIRSDRQRNAPIATQKESSGSFDAAIQVGPYNELWEGALFSEFTTASAVAVTSLVLGTSGKSITGTDLPLVAKGTVFTITSADVADWNGTYVVSDTQDSSVTEIYLDPVSYVTGPRSSATSATVNIAAQLKNGVSLKPFSFVQAYTGKQQYIVANGLVVNEFGMNISQGAIPSQTVSFLGKTIRTTTVDPRTATLPASTLPELNPTDNIKKFVVKLQDGTVKDTLIASSLQFTLSNNAQSIYGLGSEFARDISEGSVSVTGTLTFYLDDLSLLTAFNSTQQIAVFLEVQDANGNLLGIDLPYVTLTGVPVGAPGLDEVVQIDGSFEATLSPTKGYTIALYNL